MSQWIKCSDRMPDDMADVLVTDGWEVKIMWWGGSKSKWDSWSTRFAICGDDVTHWMPLPEPPEDA